jgi:poly-gamma-glutamate synthesis protein (capsule biosynthesis protein)
MRLRPLPLLLAAACAGDPAALDPADDDGTEYEAFDAEGKADGVRGLGGPISFLAACEPGDRVTVAAVGDVLLHGRLQQQAYASDQRFLDLWGEVGDLLAQADITYANLEGPTAAGITAGLRVVPDPGPVFDNKVYTGYPRFNYHPSLAQDLVDSGVDVVSTANNHALDRGGLGAEKTIEELEAAGLPFTGTRRRDGSGDWHTETDANGFRLAWVACTFSTNGITDSKKQVLGCYTDTTRLVNLVRELDAREDIDAVIVTPHWGIEYTANPRLTEVKLAHRLLDAGATVVLGGHPHVLQPWEKHLTPDGRETFVIYSLGNFVSGQRDLPRRSTLLLYLGLVRGLDGVTRVEGARYVPLHMSELDGALRLQAIDRAGGLASSRALTVRMFGEANLTSPDEPLAIATCP